MTIYLVRTSTVANFYSMQKRSAKYLMWELIKTLLQGSNGICSFLTFIVI